MRPVIVWFRRDLRVEDHAALYAAARLGAPVVPVAFDCSEFSIRRGVADAGSDLPPKITYPTAGVEPSRGSPDPWPRRPGN